MAEIFRETFIGVTKELITASISETGSSEKASYYDKMKSSRKKVTNRISFHHMSFFSESWRREKEMKCFLRLYAKAFGSHGFLAG